VAEVALFIDLENITQSLWKRYQQNADPFHWIDLSRKYGYISFAKAYGDFAQPHLARMESDLRAAGIDRFDCPTKQRGDSNQSTVDANIVIDLFEVALDRPNTGTFLLMAGDSDYARVVARLRNRLGKDVVVVAVAGSLSRELSRAASHIEILEPAEAPEVDDSALVRIIDRYEAGLREGFLPTFAHMQRYIEHPQNADVIAPEVVQSTMNRLVAGGILIQQQTTTSDGAAIRVTQLDRDHPAVAQALLS
jgi:uncharacterized LabA/DUF88 family protein